MTALAWFRLGSPLDPGQERWSLPLRREVGQDSTLIVVRTSASEAVQVTKLARDLIDFDDDLTSFEVCMSHEPERWKITAPHRMQRLKALEGSGFEQLLLVTA